MKLVRSLAVLGVLLLAAPAAEGRLMQAEYSRDELESIDLFLALLLRVARWALFFESLCFISLFPFSR